MRVGIKIFNSQVFLESLCYLFIAGLLFYFTVSGKYLTYVTPRMKPYLFFYAIVMIIWALGGLGRLFRPQYKIRFAHCFVLVIPILLLLLPHTPLNTSDFSSRYIGGGSFSGISDKQIPSDNPGPIPSKNPVISDDDNTADLPGLDTKNRKITVSNDHFYPWICEIYDNLDKYVGYRILITGFVFKDPEYFGKDEFIPARLAMTCCVADLVPLGMLCKYDKVSKLNDGDWITVEGTIFRGQYMGADEPQINVTNITPAEPIDGYIYPF